MYMAFIMYSGASAYCSAAEMSCTAHTSQISTLAAADRRRCSLRDPEHFFECFDLRRISQGKKPVGPFRDAPTLAFPRSSCTCAVDQLPKSSVRRTRRRGAEGMAAGAAAATAAPCLLTTALACWRNTSTTPTFRLHCRLDYLRNRSLGNKPWESSWEPRSWF